MVELIRLRKRTAWKHIWHFSNAAFSFYSSQGSVNARATTHKWHYPRHSSCWTSPWALVGAGWGQEENINATDIPSLASSFPLFQCPEWLFLAIKKLMKFIMNPFIHTSHRGTKCDPSLLPQEGLWVKKSFIIFQASSGLYILFQFSNRPAFSHHALCFASFISN